MVDGVEFVVAALSRIGGSIHVLISNASSTVTTGPVPLARACCSISTGVKFGPVWCRSKNPNEFDYIGCIAVFGEVDQLSSCNKIRVPVIGKSEICENHSKIRDTRRNCLFYCFSVYLKISPRFKECAVLVIYFPR